MKIRIKGNSVRLRLTQTEVAALCDNGSYSEKTQFNGSAFEYTVKADKTLAQMQAHFSQEGITVAVPQHHLNGWKDNAQVGFYHEMPLDNGNTLLLQLEKDFTCLDPREEDETDNYPNPKANLETEL